MGNKVQVCVIGAGPSGIAAAKNAIQYGFDVVVFEKNDRVGGDWVFNASTGHSSVYENTHIISSKTWSEYEDFPMPDHYPDYPNHLQLQAYFESYARHFHVLEHILFKHMVNRVTRNGDDRWSVEYTDETGELHTRIFDQLMICNGHHGNHFDFIGGTRHSTEVDYHGFRRELGRELKKAGIDIGKPPQGIKSRYKNVI